MPQIVDNFREKIQHLIGLGLITRCGATNDAIAAFLRWPDGVSTVSRRLTGKYPVEEDDLATLVREAGLNGRFDYRLFLLPLAEFQARIDDYLNAPVDPLGFLAARATSGGMRAVVVASRSVALSSDRCGRPPPVAATEELQFNNEDQIKLEIDAEAGREHFLLLDVDEDGSVYGVAPSRYAPEARLSPPCVTLPTVGDSFPMSVSVAGKPCRRALYAVLSRERLDVPWTVNPDDAYAPAVTPTGLAALAGQLARLPPGDFTVRRLVYAVQP